MPDKDKTALSEAPRWYMVNKDGMATRCAGQEDAITHAARLLREAAQELKACHTLQNSDDWTQEPDAKAAYDEHMSAAAALDEFSASIGAGGVSGPLMGAFRAAGTPAWGRGDLMAIAAVRYCLGRKSYIVGDCASWLIAAWPHISESARKTIQRDVEEEFDRDDEARGRNAEYKPLGADCDRAGWERVRALWLGAKT